MMLDILQLPWLKLMQDQPTQGQLSQDWRKVYGRVEKTWRMSDNQFSSIERCKSSGDFRYHSNLSQRFFMAKALEVLCENGGSFTYSGSYVTRYMRKIMNWVFRRSTKTIKLLNCDMDKVFDDMIENECVVSDTNCHLNWCSLLQKPHPISRILKFLHLK